MKIKEAMLNGEKIDVVVELDNDFFEENLLDEDRIVFADLENTIDLSNTMEFIIEE